ncbi:expressed unknown protein [Seminavis robusta]|uniref:Rad60/SUMO-like domain-containing protein n=1 Tax=Seminavis robusta TaxID=568900 RepID=A0A9N8E0L7_9STRA|nr:expressed unknown protein [Seminavis robusta]|eukprot:Sro527_g160570.1 n/a (400) ;mRNA; f:8279-9478
MVSTRASANSTASNNNSETSTSETDHNNSNKDVKNNNDKKKKTMESKKKSIKMTTTTTTRPAQRKDAEQMLLEATRCRTKKPAAATNLKKPPPLASNDEPLFPLPSTLLPRCVRVYGWSKSFAKRAVAAYTRFLQVQKLHPGLVPPPVIDSVWQQHVLDTSSYQSWCRTFFRKVLHYNPEQLSGRATSQAKIEILASLHATRKIVANHYTLDDDIWSIPTSATTTNNKKKRKPQDDYNHSDDDDDSTSSSSSNTDSDAPPRKRRRVDSKPAASSSPARQPLTIFVRWGQNPDPHRSSDLYFKIRPDTKMQRVFDRYTLYWNDATANANNNNQQQQQQDFCFFFGSKMVKSTDTAASLGLVTDDMIYATRCSAVEMEDDDDAQPSVPANVPVMRRTTWSP